MMQALWTRGKRVPLKNEGAMRGGVALLHRDFWLEALDERHRYGFHLRAYHQVWKNEMDARRSKSQSLAYYDPKERRVVDNTSFFQWLDHGDGKDLELPECTRDSLEKMCVAYCNADERKQFEVDLAQPFPGATHKVMRFVTTRQLVTTDDTGKWIFVIDTHQKMYISRKRKGFFHHSSFVAGAPIYAAGKIVVHQGQIKAIEPHSGHFKPALKNLVALRHIIEANGVNTKSIQFVRPKKWNSIWPFDSKDDTQVTVDDAPSDTDDYASSEDVVPLLRVSSS
ncbi:TPA: hypothetical protein N0F65_004913 [Lagenidium giganteum]|uniref:Uncharacterized protein n=1 Tax=Lagenidium giganteum TaxID=4803 RepID=A0AAV2YVZ2_9STRA|nr:TPA: hypothetical protein N0F65_004913 [Lagenidium giganteum]